MAPGEEVEVLKGQFKGRRGLISSSQGWYFSVKLLTPSGRKSSLKPVSLHKTSLAPLEK